MTESPASGKKDPKTHSIVLKSVRIKRPNHIIRTIRTQHAISNEPNVVDPVEASSHQTPTQIPNEVSSVPSLHETVSSDSNQPERSALWKGALESSQRSFSFFDRIFQPNIQYKLFLLFLSIWGASFIMFYLSTTFAIILPEPFNVIVLVFFLISTSLSGIYTFLLGLQHLRNTRQNSNDSYY